MEFQVAIAGDGALHLGGGHVHRLRLAAPQNLGHMLLQPDIKRQLHIPARFRLEITEHPDRPATRIHLHTLASRRAAQLGLQRVFDTDLAGRQVRQVAKRAVLLNLPACQGRHIAGDMASQRALRINPAQRLLEGHTRKICRADGKGRKLALGQALADQDGPE